MSPSETHAFNIMMLGLTDLLNAHVWSRKASLTKTSSAAGFQLLFFEISKPEYVEQNYCNSDFQEMPDAHFRKRKTVTMFRQQLPSIV